MRGINGVHHDRRGAADREDVARQADEAPGNRVDGPRAPHHPVSGAAYA